MKIKAVIFDMDGVLIDSENLLAEHYLLYLRSIGAPATIEDMEQLRGANHKTFWSHFVKKYQIQIPDEKHNDEIRDSFVKILKSKKIKPVPGVEEFIKQLKKNHIQIAVASSASKTRMLGQLEVINLHNHFEVRLSGQEVTQGKPHPEIFVKAAEKLNVNPKNCLVIEDSARGVEAAKAAGMKVIGFAGLPHNKENLSGADKIIYSFRGLTSDIIQSI